MGRQYSPYMKFCATCAYWLGVRDTDHFGNYAIIDDQYKKYRCMCPNGPWKNQERDPNGVCNYYLKWPVLR